ncbi:MAG TPA: hypothetical protein VIL60_10915 [Rhodanobacter sp.]
MNVTTTGLDRGERQHPSRFQYQAARATTRFLGPGQVIALAVAIIAIGVLLFPRQFIGEQLQAGGPPDGATIAYLGQLLRVQPADATIRLQLGNEQLRAGQLGQAEQTLSPLLQSAAPADAHAVSLWLALRRAQFVAKPQGSAPWQAARADYAQALRRYGAELAPIDQLAQINQAIDAGLYQTGAELAGHLLDAGDAAASTGRVLRTGEGSGPVLGPGEGWLLLGFSKLVGLVWSAQRPDSQAASRQQLTSGLATEQIRQQAFDALLRSELASGHADVALDDAQARVGTLDPHQVDWARLVELAIAAGRPSSAADFAQRWLASASDENSRWVAFNALINAHLRADQPRLALTVALRNVDRLPPTAALWRLMTRLAMQAGDAAMAADFAHRLVGLGDRHGH